VQVDALINSVGEHLDMSGGTVSNAILEAAGYDIQEELVRVASTCDVQSGSVFVTDGYGLNCTHVLHAVCSSQRDGSSVQVLDPVCERLYTV